MSLVGLFRFALASFVPIKTGQSAISNRSLKIASIRNIPGDFSSRCIEPFGTCWEIATFRHKERRQKISCTRFAVNTESRIREFQLLYCETQGAGLHTESNIGLFAAGPRV
jgi:hypothetical protein